MDFPPLYKDNRIWQISTDDTTITRSYGVSGGKLQIKESKGNKHLAQKLWQNQHMKGYKPLDTVYFSPMYHHPYQMFRNRLPKHVFVQPEYDGIRVYIEYTSDRKIKLCSEDGTEIKKGFKKIRNHFTDILTHQGLVVDGEIRNPTMTFDDLCSNYEKGNDKELEYHATDCFLKTSPTIPYRQRKIVLDVLMSGSFIEFNGIGTVNTKKMELVDVQEEFDYCALKHYEGFVIYDPVCVYTPGKRNRGYLKLKHPKHKEYKICEHGADTWTCETERGVTFTVSSLNSEKHDYVTIKFKDYMPTGVPKAPICISTRI